MNRSQNPAAGQGEYTYLAFISYKSEDKDWALWLKRQLQSYRLPAASRRKQKNLPRRCNPIFLDRTNLTPGLLDEALRREVQASKYLIVICSRNAKAHPAYLDAELRYFLEGGGDAGRVIPFIVDDCERPEINAFPAGLAALNARQVIVGANVYDAGKRMALLKVIAAMLGIRREELESEDLRRRRRNRAAAAALAVLLLAAGWKAYDYFCPKTAYFVDYTEVYGVPQGIGPLKRSELSGLSGHYAILSERGRVRELRREDSLGNLKDDSRPTRLNQFSRAEYAYENGELSSVTLYDRRGQTLLRMEYRGVNTVDLSMERRGENGEISAYAAPLSKNITALPDDLAEDRERRSSVIRYSVSYDENGCTGEIRFAANTYNDAARDAEGVSGVRYERDALGRVLRMRYLGFTGGMDTDAAKPSNFSVTARRDGLACMEFLYDEGYNLAETRYLDEAGEYLLHPAYGSVVRWEYEGHNLLRQSFLTESGEPYLNRSGIAGQEFTRDERGFERRRRNFGLRGESVLNEQGYAGWETVYDERGNEIKVSYFDTEGRPVASVFGIAGWESVFDDRGNQIRSVSFGTNGKPVPNDDGFAAWEAEYDERGNMVAVSYFDADGQPAAHRDGNAGWRAEYDPRGCQTKMTFVGTDGNPVTIADGIARWDAAYDQRGNRVRIRYFGVNGESTANVDGYAGWDAVFDERGNEIRLRFFGADGERTAHNDGYAGWDCAYDAVGNLTRKSYLDLEGSPIMIVLLYPNGNERQVYYYRIAGETTVIDCDENGDPVAKHVFEGVVRPEE